MMSVEVDCLDVINTANNIATPLSLLYVFKCICLSLTLCYNANRDIACVWNDQPFFSKITSFKRIH